MINKEVIKSLLMWQKSFKLISFPDWNPQTDTSLLIYINKFDLTDTKIHRDYVFLLYNKT